MAVTSVMMNLEQKREAGAGPALGTLTRRTPRLGTVKKTWRHLDFFQHQAFLHARVAAHNVVLGTIGLAALGHASGRPPEVDLDVEPLFLGVEVGRYHYPGRHQAECELKQIDIAHEPNPLAPSVAIVSPRSRPSRTRALTGADRGKDE
jgi:hypothetical protein